MNNDPHLVLRIAALPEHSRARWEVLKLFHCYSVATAISLFENARGEARDQVLRELHDILDRHSESETPGS